jgi:ribonucleotide reductase alpha subunit
LKFPIQEKFKLTDGFIEKYKDIKPKFGFGGLGEFVFMRTYSRLKEDGKNEAWFETVRRVVEGIYSIQKQHIEDYRLGWNQAKAQKSAQEMYDRMFNFKMLGSGRAFWAMGTDIVFEKGLTEALYNCGFISTQNIKDSVSDPFVNAMDFLMLGIGVGFDTRGSGKVAIKEQKEKIETFTIPDSREGWNQSVRLLIDSYFGGNNYEFDYSLIRPAGSPIKTFGGVSSGHKPLKQLHETIRKTLSENVGNLISETNIADIINAIGVAVVSGNVRRSAELLVGSNTEEFLDLKNYKKNKERSKIGWASNNSIDAEIGMDYSEIVKRIVDNAEPGILWISNMQKYGRMRDAEANFKDKRVIGVNPCVTGDTEVLTKKGYEEIQNLVNSKVDIWNGFEWSKVEPVITGENQQIIKIRFSDGRQLYCTPYHKFHIATNYKGDTEIVESQDLEIGMKLIKHDFPIIKEGKTLDHAYTNGFVAAEGMELKRTLWVYYPKEMCLDRLTGKRIVRQEKNNNRYRVVLDFIPLSKTFVPFEYNLSSKLEWLSGLFDGDGTELKEGGMQLTSVNKPFLENVQKMLSTIGIQSKISLGNKAGDREMPNHNGGLSWYTCLETNRLMIGAVQMQELKGLGLTCERMSFNKSPQRDASQFVSVIGIEHEEKLETVYCFNEPKNHTAIFNGILTGQCAEITLEDKELCNLVELIPSNHDSIDDFKQTIKYAYLFAKTITLLNTNWPETNKVMLRNRRIGLSITGISQFISERGIKELKEWMEHGYSLVEKYDEIYSEWFAIPKSIKTTTVKPSGTLSLLAGVTPGIHFPESRYYIRRVRLAKNSPYVEILKNSNYHVEDAEEDKENTCVVEFPVSLGEKVKTINETNIWEQLNLAAFAQESWADNSVSVTVSFRKDEAYQIKSALDIFQFKLKSVSFLPKLDNDSPYPQMPYEEISQKDFERKTKNILPLDFSNMLSVDSQNEMYCNNDVCII